MKMTDEACSKLIANMKFNGWKCDINTKEKLGFIKYINEEFEYIKEYDKFTGRYVRYNGKQKINVRSTKDTAL